MLAPDAGRRRPANGACMPDEQLVNTPDFPAKAQDTLEFAAA
ncbi:hypothetical protein BCL50_1985 [Mycolicibacterium litorale]|nr:hypothetical protein BCL50_1985 [Mycolicibacterium litorale]